MAIQNKSFSEDQSLYLIAGLGNPGKEYKFTKHNAGFMAIDIIKANYSFNSEISKFNSIIYKGTIEGKKTLLAMPMNYMNNSGNSINQIVKYYKIDLNNIIIIHDELDIALGKIKIKTGGGNGGHNGIKSIDNHLGKEYKRIRIGIDHPGDKNLVTNYVLTNFSKIQKTKLDDILTNIANNISLILNDRDDLFLNIVTSKE